MTHDFKWQHFHGMELFWSLMKRGCIGVCLCMSAKRLNRYVQKFPGRHNVRQADTITRTEGLAAMTTGSRLVHRDLLAS